MTTVRKFLLANSIFSDMSGMVMVLFSRQISTLFGIENNFIFIVIGVSLLFFSALVFLAFFIHPAKSWLVPIISSLDGLWVLGSIILVVINPLDITTKGLVALSAVAAIIALFAIGQFTNNK